MVSFPLLLIPLAIFNIIVFLMPGVDLAAALVTLPLPSGAAWSVTLSDVLLALGILMLLLEVIKGARPGAKYLTDHLLSLIVFGAAAAEFLLLPRFANSAYFLLTLLALVDFLSGVALRVRRRVPAAAVAARETRRTQAEIRHEPAELHPATPAPVNAPAAPAPSEPKFSPSEPTFTHPEPTVVPAPETPPAESQPASSTPKPPEAAH
jgi:hypothetical protein